MIFSFDGDLALLHGLEHGALGLGARAVYFVKKDEICENGAEDGLELAGLLVVDLCADDVAGQKVRRALDPRELAVEGVGDGLGGGRLGQAGDGLDQDVTVRHDGGDQGIPETRLAHHSFGEIVGQFADYFL